MLSEVDIRRTDGIGAHKILGRKIVAEADRGGCDACFPGEWEIAREAGLPEGHNLLLRSQNCPLRSAQRDRRIAAVQAVAAEAPDGCFIARLGPGLCVERLHEVRAPDKINPAVDCQPELAALCHCRAADADALCVLGRNCLKDCERAIGRKTCPRVAVVGRQHKFLFKIPFHGNLLYRCIKLRLFKTIIAPTKPDCKPGKDSKRARRVSHGAPVVFGLLDQN